MSWNRWVCFCWHGRLRVLLCESRRGVQDALYATPGGLVYECLGSTNVTALSLTQGDPLPFEGVCVSSEFSELDFGGTDAHILPIQACEAVYVVNHLYKWHIISIPPKTMLDPSFECQSCHLTGQRDFRLTRQSCPTGGTVRTRCQLRFCC